VGVVRRRSANVADIEFYYARSWLAAQASFPISTLMPLGDQIYGPDLVYPWLLNLLPEGSALKAVGAILKVDEQDVVGMLKEMGADLPGALSIPLTSIGAAPRPRYHRLSEVELADILRKLPQRPLLVGEDGVHMSLAGAQDKLAVAVDRNGAIALPLDGAASTHILKPANKYFHSAVANEAFCLRLARAIGMSAARVEVGKAEDIEYLLVERYDRRKSPEGLRRVHQEDLCQATATPPYLKYEWNANVAQPGPGIRSCMDALGTTRRPANKIRFFEYMLFNVLCGNVDAHAKNYSILFDGQTQVLAPLYDVMNGDIYEGVTKNLAMKIAGKQRGDHIHGRHWDRLAEENGLNGTLLRARVKAISRLVLETLPKVVAEMESSALPTGTYAEIAAHIERHCKNMLANLKTEPAPETSQSLVVAVEDLGQSYDADDDDHDDHDDHDDYDPVRISPGPG
jgi:serine/threonine-protein kinase HipA